MATSTIAGPFRTHYIQYLVTSVHQAYPTPLRILEPDSLNQIAHPRIVYVLPVNPDISWRWHDGLDTFLQAGYHNTYGMIAVAPAFSDWPWYANHPTDQSRQQETFLVDEIVPFIDQLYPQASRVRLLLGFSKSGNGAFQLLLRHPDIFYGAAVWDAPLMQAQPNQFEMPDIYGTQVNFNRYHIPTLLEENAATLRATIRLALFGYGLFGGPHPPPWSANHVGQAHTLMQNLAIPHLYDNSINRAHRWDSGWMSDAVAALNAMTSETI